MKLQRQPGPLGLRRDLTSIENFIYRIDGLRSVRRHGKGRPFRTSFGVSTDKRALVDIAHRVDQAMNGGKMTTGSALSGTGDAATDALVLKARSKVIPFLDEEQAQSLSGLVDALESGENGDREPARRALEAELRKYSYLL